jgi:hypothetical protein
VAFVLLDIAQTAVRGQLLQPKIYLPFVLHYVVLAVIGMFVPSRRYHALFGWYTLVTLSLWSLVVRRFLGG